MRLTTVAHMSLPPGRLRSYRVRAGARVRALPISFDQARHVGAGDRPGSWMAFAFRVPAGVGDDELERAWLRLVARHGTLRTVFSHDAGALALHEVAVSPGSWRDHEVPTGTAVRDVLRAVLDRTCRPFEEPSHTLCIVRPEAGEVDPRPVVVIAADHAHVDMWSLAVAARDFLEALNEKHDDPTDATGSAAAPPAASFAEHTALLAAMPPAPEHIAARWAGILDAADGAMPVFPLPLGDVSSPVASVVEVRDVLDADQLRGLEVHARELGVRAITLTVSVLTEVAQRLAGAPLRAVFPVHSRHEDRWRDALGWFVTNSVIVCADPRPDACVASVRDAIELGGYPLAPLLAPYGGMRTPPGMFALSWLDVRRLPVPPELALDAQFVSAVIETDGVMAWFITNESGLHLRCRYPDTPEARASLTAWLSAVEHGLRALAG